MQPILIYDGHCNLCVNFVKMVEPFNDEGKGRFKVRLVPYQKADELVTAFKLDKEALKSAFHLIDENGNVFKAGQAIDKLADIYPLLKFGSPFLQQILEKLFIKRLRKIVTLFLDVGMNVMFRHVMNPSKNKKAFFRDYVFSLLNRTS
ncbi:thiol-disulfide oxidoreductase DCC family protein [Chloroherpeton thalassium]|uniref:thiol-disulfide oxidoreductase DCC family protein n=1 Tax=Chloroherpeton thalassium TaxID=100716 RepID=UPI0002D36E19|nr:DCC1-like thiol-disulfide oxidoreductase family protein [Chloroherpeton thalassium]